MIFACGVALLGACSDEPEAAQTVVDHVKPEVPDAGSRGDAKSEPEEDEALDARLPMPKEDAATLADAAVSDAAPARDAKVDASRLDAGPMTACANGKDLPFARGLKIRELSVYQTVKVPLFRAGAWATSTPVPVVAGKQTLVRVFVDTQSGYSAHRVRAVLELNGKQSTTEQDEKSLAKSSSDADPESTFSFRVDGDEIEADTQFTVSLHETTCDAMAGNAADVRLPTSGSRSLGAEVIGKLKVVVVPIEMGGRVPKTDPSEQTKIREAVLAYYPVAEVELSVRASVLKWNNGLTANDGSAWSNVLNQVMRVRAADNAEDDVYYYGLMQPAATFSAFCGRGCIVGMAPQTTRVSPSEQAGLSVYFTENAKANQTTVEAIVHELGHAHGRGHAPCVEGGTIAGVDQSFPDRTGATGGWGWDSRSDALIPPTHKDIMGYCSPDWISAYTYAGLAARSQRVNSLTLIHGDAMQTWQRVLLYADGGARWGGATVSSLPGGELEDASVLDGSGRVITSTQVVRVKLSHSDDQILYLPNAPAEWAALILSDRTLALGQIQAPLF